MKKRVAILVKKKSDVNALLTDLNLSEEGKVGEAFFSWEDVYLSEQKEEYDFILIDYSFVNEFKNDIALYSFFIEYKPKIILFRHIQSKVNAQKGKVVVNKFRLFFKPFLDFDELMNKDAVGIPGNVSNDTFGGEKEIHLNETFFLKEGYSLIRFDLNEVLCLESDRNYITVYLSNGKHLIRETLHSVLKILPSNFIRVNRSVIINIDKIHKVEGNRIYIHDLDCIQPSIANKYKLNVLNALPIFNQKKTEHWKCYKNNKSA